MGVFLAGPRAIGWTQFKDGNTHDIDYMISHDVWVDYLSPGMGTTVNVVDRTGGEVPVPVTLFVMTAAGLPVLLRRRRRRN